MKKDCTKNQKFEENKKRIKIWLVAKIKCTLTYFNGQKKSCAKKQKAEKKSCFQAFDLSSKMNRHLILVI